MPLIRRLPKFGFSNPFRTQYAIVNVKSFENWRGGDTITPQAMVEAGLVKRSRLLIKILGSGELKKPLVVHAHKFSKSAEAKIQAAGGRVEVISGA